MSDDLKITIEGLAECQVALRQLPDATAKNILRRIGRERLKPIADRARQLAPMYDGGVRYVRNARSGRWIKLTPGALKGSITVGTTLTRRQRSQHQKLGPDDVEIFAGPSSVPQAHMMEFGTEHTSPQPFMRPAWDQGKDQLLQGIAVDLWMEIDKAAQRLARKAAKRGG